MSHRHRLHHLALLPGVILVFVWSGWRHAIASPGGWKSRLAWPESFCSSRHIDGFNVQFFATF
jgi:hypothetical protein